VSRQIVTRGGKRKGAGPRGAQQHPFFEKIATGEFFERLIPNDLEIKYWRYFMSGYITEYGWDGNPVKIIPIPLDPIMWQAFKRAVEYKRGMPIQPVAARLTSNVPVQIISNVALQAVIEVKAEQVKDEES